MNPIKSTFPIRFLLVLTFFILLTSLFTEDKRENRTVPEASTKNKTTITEVEKGAQRARVQGGDLGALIIEGRNIEERRNVGHRNDVDCLRECMNTQAGLECSMSLSAECKHGLRGCWRECAAYDALGPPEDTAESRKEWAAWDGCKQKCDKLHDPLVAIRNPNFKTHAEALDIVRRVGPKRWRWGAEH